MLTSPASLQDICMHAFGRVLHETVYKLLRILVIVRNGHRLIPLYKECLPGYNECFYHAINNPKHPDQFNNKILKPLCTYLEESMETIPISILQEFTMRLQMRVFSAAHAVDYILFRGDDRPLPNMADLYQDIFSQVLASITSSNQTYFEIGIQDVSPILHCTEGVFLLRVLKKLRAVKTLKLYDFKFKTICTDIWKFDHLEEFIFMRGCNDKILDIVSKNCQNLKKLSISFSREVSDESINHILRFKNLKELDIYETGISTKGVSNIMKIGITACDGTSIETEADSRLNLTAFTSELSKSQMTALPDCFPNLTSHILCLQDRFSLLSLTKLKNLRSLTFTYSRCRKIKFKDIMEILSVIGKQVVYLELMKITGANLTHIAKMCPSLKILNFLYLAYDLHEEAVDPPPPAIVPLPDLPSVEYCKINLWFDVDYVENILSRLVNITVLEINWEVSIADRHVPLLCYIFHRMNEPSLLLKLYGVDIRYSDGYLTLLYNNKYYSLKDEQEFVTMARALSNVEL